jgi:penicillin-binding protein 1A
MADSRGTRRRNSENQARKPEPPRPRRGRRILSWLVGVAALAMLVLGVVVAIAVQSLPDFDSLKESQVGQTIIVRARDGTEIVTLGPSPGDWLPSRQIPQVMKDAMISVEDRRFRSHIGIDPLGLVRAVYVSFRDDSRPEATSTITQQLARNIFLNNSRTMGRKVREAILAMALEWKFSKEEILELYLNKVYFGGGAYGIDSASRKFFSHSARQLTVAEAAIIAGLVKAPSRYSPTADVQAAVKRANVVLDTMRRNGVLAAEEAAAVDVSAVRLKPETGGNSVRYFTDWALPQLDLLLPDTQEPLEVWTTLDIAMQGAATAAIHANAPQGAQGALVSLDRDGGVLAMVGGTDYVASNYNRATNALRQPGSAWKLFVYLAALEAGYIPDDRVVDEPVSIQGWSPRNSGGGYAGEIDVRTAFAYSKNTVAAQLGNDVGFGSVASMARRFGISTPINTMPSMVLGSSEVRVIDLVRAFAAVAARGNAVEPYGITKVATTKGKVLYEHKPKPVEKLVPDYVAAGITDLLQTAVNVGTGRAAQIGRPVAGKTGTTSSNKDGWFVGFSSGITTGVWMGRDDAKPVPGLQGGAAPARAFAQYMKQAVAKRPVEKFDTELKLPEWQLEPDDEYLMGQQGDYYYVDELGNLVDQNRPGTQGDLPPPDAEAPPAASDDFLDRATGGAASPPPTERNGVTVRSGNRSGAQPPAQPPY